MSSLPSICAKYSRKIKTFYYKKFGIFHKKYLILQINGLEVYTIMKFVTLKKRN